MNTPAHAIVNLLILGRRDHPRESLPITIGAILPDLPMVFFYLYEKIIDRIPEQTIWSETYFKPEWQAFFDLFNSLPLILIGLLLAYYAGKGWLIPLFLSMIFHVFGDLPLHNDDAHAHFFPLSDWQFKSPISYWDPAHYGDIVAPIEAMIVVIGAIVLVRRYRSPYMRGLVASVALLYVLYWGYVFWVWKT